LRKEYEKYKNNSATVELSEDDENSLRVQVLDEIEKASLFDTDEFNKVLDSQFSVFKDGEKYDYVKDMKSAF
jgi:hypothetical protein